MEFHVYAMKTFLFFMMDIFRLISFRPDGRAVADLWCMLPGHRARGYLVALRGFVDLNLLYIHWRPLF